MVDTLERLLLLDWIRAEGGGCGEEGSDGWKNYKRGLINVMNFRC